MKTDTDNARIENNTGYSVRQCYIYHIRRFSESKHFTAHEKGNKRIYKTIMRAMDKRIIRQFNRLVSRSGYSEEQITSASRAYELVARRP